MVADSIELHDGEDAPADAVGRGWNMFLLKEQVEDIVDSLRMQTPQPGVGLALQAVTSYLNNDSFLTVS